MRTFAREIIRLRLESDRLDTEGLRRHLTGCGFAALLIDIDRAATHAGAPFMKSDVTLAAARSQWSYAFEVLNRLAALEDAVTAAKLALGGAVGASALVDLEDGTRSTETRGQIGDDLDHDRNVLTEPKVTAPRQEP